MSRCLNVCESVVGGGGGGREDDGTPTNLALSPPDTVAVPYAHTALH